MDQRRAIIVVSLTLHCLIPFRSWAWSPEVTDHFYSKECHPQLFSWRFLEARSPELKSKLLKSWLAQCDSEFRLSRPQGEEAHRHLESLEGPPHKFEPIQFNDRKGLEHSGWALMKPEKRPAILILCEWSCDPIEDPWLKQAIMQLYEEGPFHLFLIESPESKLSERWLAGSFDSGAELLEAGWWLNTASPYRGRISSLHLLGRGTTATASLYAHWMNDLNPIADDRKVFQGGAHFCPAVRLAPLLEALQRPSTESQNVFHLKWFEHLFKLQGRYPFWQRPLTEDGSVSDLWLNASLALKPIYSTNINPFRQMPPQSREDWLQMSDFAYLSSRHHGAAIFPRRISRA